jgi:roadblock/LC7 domain-containing protein
MIHGHIDGMIEAKEQVVEGFAIAPYQGGDHSVWICGNRGAFDRRDRADVDVAAGLDELLDVRPRRGWREVTA